MSEEVKPPLSEKELEGVRRLSLMSVATPAPTTMRLLATICSRDETIKGLREALAGLALACEAREHAEKLGQMTYGHTSAIIEAVRTARTALSGGTP